MTNTNHSIAGVQTTVLGFFISWLFQETSVIYVGIVLVVIGTIVTAGGLRERKTK